MKKLMNAVMVAAVSAFAVTANAASPEKDPGSEAIGWTAVSVGLASPVALPWGFDMWDVRGINFSLFFADAVEMDGVALALGGTMVHEDLKGAAFGGVFNYDAGNVYGLRASVGPNITRANVYGCELGLCGYRDSIWGLDAAFIGSMQNYFTGCQISGVSNVSRIESYGCDIAGVINMAKKAYGCQIAGVMNQTDELHGCQIGLINYAETCPWGFQIGLINIIMQNKVKILPVANLYF